MNRHVIGGLVVAGALSLWAGGTAVAATDPAATLLHTAHGYAAAASDKVSGCAETQITKLEAQTPPAGLDPEARNQAVETANEKVLQLTEGAQENIAAQFESFSETVDRADEDGGTLPTAAALAAFKASVDKIASDACDMISKVTITWPNPTTVKPGDTETEQGDESDNESKHNESKHTESKDTESHTVATHASD